MKALIFAAGLGTRLKEETLNKPKALVEIGGKPLVQHVLEKLRGEGINEFVVNVHHFPDMIISFLKGLDLGVNIQISDERDELLETGGALKKAAFLLQEDNEPVLLYNVDILSDIDVSALLREHRDSGALATLVVRNRQTQRYFMFNHFKRLVGWINRKTGEKRIALPVQYEDALEMAFSGIHIVMPEIFNLMPEEKRFSITDLYLNLAGTHIIKGYFDKSLFWLDVGKPESLAQARSMYN